MFLLSDSLMDLATQQIETPCQILFLLQLCVSIMTISCSIIAINTDFCHIMTTKEVFKPLGFEFNEASLHFVLGQWVNSFRLEHSEGCMISYSWFSFFSIDLVSAHMSYLLSAKKLVYVKYMDELSQQASVRICFC